MLIEMIEKPYTEPVKAGKMADSTRLSGNTITLTDPGDAVYFERDLDMMFEFAPGEFRSGKLMVTSVDREAGVITTSPSIRVGIPAASITDTIYVCERKTAAMKRSPQQKQAIEEVKQEIAFYLCDPSPAVEAKSSGAKCNRCGEFNQYAEASSEYRCYACRN